MTYSKDGKSAKNLPPYAKTVIKVGKSDLSAE